MQKMIEQNDPINEITKGNMLDSKQTLAQTTYCASGIARTFLLEHRIFSMHRHVVIPSSVVWIEENRMVLPKAPFTT